MINRAMKDNDKLAKTFNNANSMKKETVHVPIKMPPTRDGFYQLCKMLNLKITPTKVLDALLFIRGP